MTKSTSMNGNSFNKTPPADQLRRLGVDTVIITGFCAEYCVLSTYRGAKDLDLTPILLRGSLASETPENIKFVESVSSKDWYTIPRDLPRHTAIRFFIHPVHRHDLSLLRLNGAVVRVKGHLPCADLTDSRDQIKQRGLART
jgi:hypothetical protein